MSHCPDEEQLKYIGDRMSRDVFAVGDVYIPLYIYHHGIYVRTYAGSWSEIHIRDG